MQFKGFTNSVQNEGEIDLSTFSSQKHVDDVIRKKNTP